MRRNTRFHGSALWLPVFAALLVGAANILPALAADAGNGPQPAAADGSQQPYTLQPGDHISVSVLGHQELRSSLAILPDGTITFPIAGKIHAAGMTSDQLAAALDNGLKSQCNDPQATVTVDQATLPPVDTVSILGVAHAPGVHDLRPGERILQLIADAGGIDGDVSLVQGILVTDQGARSVKVDIGAIMSGADQADNYVLKPNDILLLQQRDPSFDQVQVIDEVNKPGSYSVPLGGESVLKALTDAGGATPNAALDRAQLLHAGQTTVIDLRALQTSLAAPATTITISPGDVLMIPINDAKIAILGGVHSPATYTIPDGEVLSVSEALAMAGGTDDAAEMHNAVILRRNKAGTMDQIPVDVDPLDTNVKTVSKAKGAPPAELACNAYMSPGDVLYVPEKAPGHPSSNLNQLTPLAALALAAKTVLF